MKTEQKLQQSYAKFFAIVMIDATQLFLVRLYEVSSGSKTLHHIPHFSANYQLSAIMVTVNTLELICTTLKHSSYQVSTQSNGELDVSIFDSDN